MPGKQRVLEAELFEEAMASLRDNNRGNGYEVNSHHLQGYMKDGTASITTVQSEPYTFAGFHYEGRYAVGFAKCNPIDVWNYWTGTEIAVKRAIRNHIRKSPA